MTTHANCTPLLSRPESPGRWRLLVLLAVGLAGSGCAALAPKETPTLTAEVIPGHANAPAGYQAALGSSYTVEIRTAKGHSQSKQQELSGPLRVQEALEGTKANKKFRRFMVELHRPLPDGRMHKMHLEYDRSAKRVEPIYDYAIVPGDRIIVTEDASTVVDDVLKIMNSPLGGGQSIPGLSSGSKAGARYKIVGE